MSLPIFFGELVATIGFCKKCGEKDKLLGGLCENCRLEIEAKHSLEFEEKREAKSREELERELAERRRDKKFWLSSK